MKMFFVLGATILLNLTTAQAANIDRETMNRCAVNAASELKAYHGFSDSEFTLRGIECTEDYDHYHRFSGYECTVRAAVKRGYSTRFETFDIDMNTTCEWARQVRNNPFPDSPFDGNYFNGNPFGN